MPAKYDMIRINKVENGWTISLRPEGQAPQSYAYKTVLVAKSPQEAAIIVREILCG